MFKHHEGFSSKRDYPKRESWPNNQLPGAVITLTRLKSQKIYLLPTCSEFCKEQFFVQLGFKNMQNAQQNR